MSDFELLEPTPHLCRKRDTGRIFVLKSFNTRNRHDSSEQTILGILKTLDAPFLPQVYWSFRDENYYHMVMVRSIINIHCFYDTGSSNRQEYYPRHNLSSQLTRSGALSPAHTLFYACEIVSLFMGAMRLFTDVHLGRGRLSITYDWNRASKSEPRKCHD